MVIRTLRFLVLAVVGGLVVWFIVARRQELAEAVDAIGDARPIPLAIAVALSLAAVVNRGALHRASHRAVGMDMGLGSMIRVSAAAYAVNKAVKTGGLAGLALFIRHGSNKGRSAAHVTAACLLVSALSFVALISLVSAALAHMFFFSSLPPEWIAIAVAFIGVGGIAVVLVSIAARSGRFVGGFHRWVKRSPVGPDRIDQFSNAVTAAAASPRSSIPVLVHALLAKLLGAAILAASLWATGAQIGLGAALVTYAIALVAASVGLLPGGVGVVEASTASLLTALGVDPSVGLAAVLVFRTLDVWLPLIVGAALARSIARAAEPSLDLEPTRGRMVPVWQITKPPPLSAR